ncbi:ATP-dependent helicase smarcad1 [Porites harrisoni]
MATLVEMFPSETRLQLVDAITSSSSIEEAVNSVCDNLTANSSSDDNAKSHSERVKKRKRHFIISDDEDDRDVKCSPKRTCGGDDGDDCVVIDDDELEEIDDPTDSDSDYTDESPKSNRRNKHLHVPHEVSSTNNKNPAQEGDVICLSDEEDTGENDYVQVLNIVDCTGIGDDSDDENYKDEEMTTILSFFNDCSIHELAAVPSLSVKKAEKIIKMRPFDSWDDLVLKLDAAPNLSSQLIENCQSLLDERKGVEHLMNKCEEISSKIQDMLTLRLSAINDNSSVNGKIRGTVITSQPKSLNNSLQLKPYQLTSLNWLVLMHEQGVNAILADEMGLGKTVQAIAFIAHLCETGEKGPHLIVVPASTLDNWCREIKTWCPSMDFSMYYGSQEERRLLRIEAEFRQLKPQIVITTYSVANGNDEDRRFLRKLNCNYLVLDEGHMLKNMQSQRYQGLMRMKAQRRLLLTGTPLQNNLLELMSLLSFVMPRMFGESFEGIKMLFSNYSKMSGEPGSNYEKATVAQAKRIMKPFVLRRLKSDVLQQLPAKHDHVIKWELTERQRELYNDSFVNCSKQFKQSGNSSQYNNILMTLRKAANHPLLLRSLYTDETLLEMAKKYCKDPAHRDSEPDLVFEDMTVMSDFELHNLCREERRLADHCLQKEVLIKSGKFVYLDALLPELKGKNCRVLLFSQFTMVMDIIEVYLSDRRHRYLRLDGQTSVVERQGLIDKFNGDADIFVFLLSTKAGGLGINLTSANVVILHDIDFNPYNDKQAEDRCHRVGQTREVTVYRLIAKDTIEEAILQCAQSKLRLEQDMAASDKDESASPKDVSELLQEAFNNVSGTIQP